MINDSSLHFHLEGISNYSVNNKITLKKKSYQASAFHMQNTSLRVISRILPAKKFSEVAW